MILKTAYQAHLFVITAPSGAGKSSLVNALTQTLPRLKQTISYTTRQPRPGESHGKEYYFVSEEAFLDLIKEDAFLEYATVHGNYYGTSREYVSTHLKAGIDLILEIDWQGARQIKKQFPQAMGIFILPPSIQTLKERLCKRGQDSASTIEKRVLAAQDEIIHANEFEYVIINEAFDVACSELVSIITASRCQFSQQVHHHTDLFRTLGVPFA